ncbi:FAD/NAD(P)-binding protein [Pseudonocardia saturnea]
MERDVVVIGAGATGVSLFGQLVRGAAEHLRSVTVVDTAEPGGGPVFGDPDADVLCNTSAGIQSLFPDEPEDFLDFCRADGRPVDPVEFVARGRVGEYCRTRFREHAELARSKGIAVAHRPGRVQRVASTPQGRAVHLDDGTRLLASDVAVCVGLGAPRVPDGFGPHVAHPRFVCSPFPTTAVRARLPRAGARVLVAGSGLSAVDTAVLLCRDGHDVTIASRTGVLPAVRSHTLPAPRTSSIRPASLDDLPVDGGPADPVRRLRDETELVEAGRCHWQDVVLDVADAVTRSTAGMPLAERNALLGPHRSAMWRYMMAIALPNARTLLRHVDDGALHLTAYDPAGVSATARGFAVTLSGGRTAEFDQVVAAAGFGQADLFRRGDSVHIGRAPDGALPVRELGADLRLRPDDGPGGIWVAGSATHVREPFASFLRTATRQARTVVDGVADRNRPEETT